jgi:hypothetical protein
VKVLVCGSRDWTDEDAIADVLAEYAPDYPTIIHGAARGADSIADRVAKTYGYTVKPFAADWYGMGRRAGIIRNLRMLDENPDLVIAFQINGSRGTQHTIDEARRRGIPVEVHAAPFDADASRSAPASAPNGPDSPA